MKKANEYGFLPGNDGESNARALQSALNGGGEVFVEAAGIYDISETVLIDDNTTLVFAKGTQVRRQPSKNGISTPVLLNRGYRTATYNKNITVIGLHVDCNGVENEEYGFDSSCIGLRAHVGMIFVKDLVIRDYQCVGLLKEDYGIQISAFENVLIEHIFCEGDKDGVHLGWGRNFVIRHGKFRTFDDPIALNAFDYSTSNTHVGWIENGLIEDCYDLNDRSTTGYFCRILGGAWCDWKKGMSVQHSDTICHNGRVYRAVLQPDGKFRVSDIPPTHSEPWIAKEYGGIKWVMVRDEAVYDCGCRNITIRDIHLQKKRTVAVAISLNNDVWARSYTVGCTPVPQENITLEKVYIENEIDTLLESNHPCGNITVADTDLKGASITFRSEALEALTYPTVDLTLKNVKAEADSVMTDGKHTVNLEILP